jgi:hypothetical protein
MRFVARVSVRLFLFQRARRLAHNALRLLLRLCLLLQGDDDSDEDGSEFYNESTPDSSAAGSATDTPKSLTPVPSTAPTSSSPPTLTSVGSPDTASKLGKPKVHTESVKLTFACSIKTAPSAMRIARIATVLLLRLRPQLIQHEHGSYCCCRFNSAACQFIRAAAPDSTTLHYYQLRPRRRSVLDKEARLRESGLSRSASTASEKSVDGDVSAPPDAGVPTATPAKVCQSGARVRKIAQESLAQCTVVQRRTGRCVVVDNGSWPV